MNLKLKNIGIVEQADIKLNGLTVIAGKNDSGKSTVGKVLYALIKSTSKSHMIGHNVDMSNQYVKPFNRYITNLFKNQISEKGKIDFFYNNTQFDIDIENNRCLDFKYSSDFISNDLSYYGPILIDTPYIWSIFASLKTIRNLEAHDNQIDFEIMDTLNDLYLYLTTKLKFTDDKIKLDMQTIIGGKFEENSLGNYSFNKGDEPIELVNTAMGIKYFGMLQVLSDNNYFYKGQVLVLDEPEVHLHPSWQLELAKIIVHLVEKGVKVLVNSHSPYMIEALQRYGELENVESDFYIAQENKIEKIENSNSRTLDKIFEKLSEPFDVFENMERDKL